MLSALDLLNRLLGYFNIQDKAKGKAFTVIAFVSNFYLLYLAINHLRFPGYRLQGGLFLLAFVIILYFVVLNYIYYWTDKKAKFDISPYVAKLIGGDDYAKREAEEAMKQRSDALNGQQVYAEEDLLPTTLLISSSQQRHLDTLVTQLVNTGRLTLNYGGLSEEAITRVVQQTQAPALAIGQPMALPYATVKEVEGELQLFGGLNALNTQSLATIAQVGLTSATTALKDYNLVVASALLVGGESQHLGRSTLIKQREPYGLIVKLAAAKR